MVKSLGKFARSASTLRILIILMEIKSEGEQKTCPWIIDNKNMVFSVVSILVAALPMSLKIAEGHVYLICKYLFEKEHLLFNHQINILQEKNNLHAWFFWILSESPSLPLSTRCTTPIIRVIFLLPCYLAMQPFAVSSPLV